MDISIRDFLPADADGVNRVALAAFAQYEQHYEGWSTYREGIGRTADLAIGADLIVAARPGIVGAVVHVPPERPRMDIFPASWSVIRMLVVDPDQRSQGIGKRLVAAALTRAQLARAPAIGLHTSPIMTEALALYLRLGFVRDRDLPPNRGVPYARYVLPQAAVPAALNLLSRT